MAVTTPAEVNPGDIQERTKNDPDQIMIRKAILAQILLTTAVFPQEANDVTRLMHQAVNHEHDVFINSYLAEKFFSWQRHFPIESLAVDTLFSKGRYYEAWLSTKKETTGNSARLAILYSNVTSPSIIDIRTLLLAQEGSFNPNERAVIELIERFVWTYETGIDGFLLDLLYPRHIGIRYSGSDNAKNIVSELRRKHEYRLPIQAIDWENRGPEHLIRLTLDSPLNPLELSVNMYEYLTFRFFEDKDKSNRIKALRDSIYRWPGDPGITRRKDTAVKAESASKALEKFLGREFAAYDLNIIDRSKNTATIEAILPPIHDIKPSKLRYLLESQPNGADRYAIVASFIPLSEQDLPRTGPDYSAPMISAINEMSQRYGSLGLGDVLSSSGLVDDKPITGILILHGNVPDSVVINRLKSYSQFLRALSRDKLCYFFLRSATDVDETITASGYAIWQSRSRNWHHLAGIKERYRPMDDSYQLSEVTVDIYPYIREDYLVALFGFEDDTTGRKSFRIKR